MSGGTRQPQSPPPPPPPHGSGSGSGYGFGQSKTGNSQFGNGNGQINYFMQQSQLVVVVALLGGIALALYLWTVLGDSAHSGAAPAVTATVTATVVGIAPSGGAAPPADQPSGGSGGGSGSGWKAKYSNKQISLPQPSSECSQSFVDFEPEATAGQLDLNAMVSSSENHDLVVQSACVSLYPQPLMGVNGQRWGSGPADPSPDKCYDQSGSKALEGTLPLAKVEQNSTYCLVTGNGSLVWLKVTGRNGSKQLGLNLVATLWTK